MGSGPSLRDDTKPRLWTRSEETGLVTVMRIARSTLTELVVTEVRRRLRELVEASPASEEDAAGSKPKKSKGKKKNPSLSAADQEPVRKGNQPTGPQPETAADMDAGAEDPSTPNANQEEDPGGATVDGDQPDPDSDQLAADDEEDSVDADGENGEEPSGAVNDFMSGKTVQSISVEPDSKLLPGAKAVIITFNETTDSVQILVTATGMVKFFAQGQLHDLP